MTKGTSWCGGVAGRGGVVRLLTLGVHGVMAVQEFRIGAKSMRRILKRSRQPSRMVLNLCLTGETSSYSLSTRHSAAERPSSEMMDRFRSPPALNAQREIVPRLPLPSGPSLPRPFWIRTAGPGGRGSPRSRMVRGKTKVQDNLPLVRLWSAQITREGVSPHGDKVQAEGYLGL